MPKTAQTSVSADRITVGLTKRSAEELEYLHGETGLSKTDLVNRSIGLYKFITDHLEKGEQLVIRDRDGKDMLVHMQ
ncbi:MAG TPA: hypothetical protein VIZ70_04740 [Propionibacteriaceae bacterium]